jgi:hypothetical protein
MEIWINRFRNNHYMWCAAAAPAPATPLAKRTKRIELVPICQTDMM